MSTAAILQQVAPPQTYHTLPMDYISPVCSLKAASAKQYTAAQCHALMSIRANVHKLLTT